MTAVEEQLAVEVPGAGTGRPDPRRRRGGGGGGGHGVALFVIRRLGWTVATLFVLSVLIFLATHVLPGDPAAAALGTNATEERLALLRDELGLDHPLLEQYTGWVGDLATGDLGTSLANRQAVSDLVGTRVVNSLVLIALASLASVPLSIFLGVRAATRPGGPVDRAINLLVLVLAGIPEFVVGVILIAVFATGLSHVLPAVSLIDAGRPVLSQWRAFVLPASSVALVCIPYVTRMTRAAMIEALSSDYAQYATLNGVRRRRVGYRHCLPNALPAIVQATALTVGYIAGSSVVIEAVFNLPGVGSGLVQAVNSRDYPVVQALALFIAVFYVVVLALADLVTALSIPRVRSRL